MEHKIYTYFNNNKVITFLNLLIIIIPIVPYSYVYGNTYETEDLYWMPRYVFDDALIFFLYLFFVVFTIGFQLLKKDVYRRIFLIVFSIFSLLSFLYGVIALLIPIQDFMPSLGNLLMMAVFPSTMFLLRIENKLKQSPKGLK